MSSRLVMVLALAMGCSEYNIAQPPNLEVEPNPPGVENPINTDRVVQVTEPAVDVLWVIDNSGSMDDNQAALADNFPSFMDYFLGSGLDYHIGVVSTDMDNQGNGNQGMLREIDGVRFIDTDTPDPMGTYQRMAKMGAGGSSTEKGRAAAYTAIELRKNEASNIDFIRDGIEAGLHIVVISDENDSSTNNPISKVEFIDYLNTLRDDPELVTFNAIVNPPGGGGIFAELDAGTEYLDITDQVGGLKREIQTGDWAAMLEDLGVQAAGLKREYFLSSLPVVDSIEVWVITPDGSTLPFTKGQDYTYTESRNSVLFETFIPTALSEVYIEYTVLASVLQ